MQNSYQTIKNLMKSEDGPVFVADEQGMKYVVMTFDKYQKMASNSSGGSGYMDFDITDLTGDEMLEAINKKISQWKAAQDDEEGVCLGKEDNFEDIEIEDIPF